MDFERQWGVEAREFAEHLLRFETVAGAEREAQEWIREQLESFGFETYEWEADPETLADHPSFPDDPDTIDAADRPSVAGVLEFGDPTAGPTLVLNGHVDVVPAGRGWEGDPFTPRWNGDSLTARGAVDMKCGLTACIFAARHLEGRSDDADLDGRIVVESVAGEEDGGIGAAAAALENPYPFDRNAAIIAEPTALTPVIAVEGSLMKRLRLEGRSAHAATRWRGESVLPQFERIRGAFEALEAERSERVTHPLYDEYPIPWPVNVGRLEAGEWASSVPDSLTAELRIGVAPGETVTQVEAEFDARLDSVVADDPWLANAPPTFERFSVQFEPAAIDPEERIVRTLQSAMRDAGLEDVEPRGVTYGADSRHYVAAGVPTVVFGPGSIEQAHFPRETIDWTEVSRAGSVIAETARRFVGSSTS